MAQQNLFPPNVNKQKQPHLVASKPQTVQPSVNMRRQAAPPQNRSSERTYGPQLHPQNANSSGMARPQAQRSETVHLSGRIGRYFEVKQTATGKSLATFSLATQKPYRDESGNWLKRTVWQRIVAWGDMAQSLNEQLRQGARISVDGQFKTREWTDRENNLRTTTELVARHVHFLEGAGNRVVA